MNRFAALLLPLAFIAAAQAAPAARPDCELALDADTVEANVLGGRGGTASGNVVVTRCDMKLRADTVRLFMVNGQYERIVANGKVLLTSDRSGIVSGDNGVYEVARQFVTMTGNVVYKNGRNVASGTRLTYNVATGQVHFDAQSGVAAAPGAPATGNGRVHAILGSPAKSGTNP